MVATETGEEDSVVSLCVSDDCGDASTDSEAERLDVDRLEEWDDFSSCTSALLPVFPFTANKTQSMKTEKQNTVTFQTPSTDEKNIYSSTGKPT